MEWWSSLVGLEKIYWGIAIVFTVLFVIQFVLSFVGLDVDADADFDAGADVDGVDSGFTILSVRSIIAFFTFFGWTGVVCLDLGLPPVITAVISFATGFGAMFLVGYVIYFFLQLQSSGTLDIDNALSQVGEVYLVVPESKKGTGKVQIKVQGTLRELDAITNGEAIPTGTMIRVIDILQNNTLVVEPVVEQSIANE
ncbi:MAG: hypothetical protein AAF598_07035 [Bacteroidota bacterium]